jgi:hypothetical protein
MGMRKKRVFKTIWEERGIGGTFQLLRNIRTGKMALGFRDGAFSDYVVLNENDREQFVKILRRALKDGFQKAG